MNSIKADAYNTVLTRFFNDKTNMEISDEQKQRVLAPAIKKIESLKTGNNHCEVYEKKAKLAYASALLVEKTSTGKLPIIIIEN